MICEGPDCSDRQGRVNGGTRAVPANNMSNTALQSIHRDDSASPHEECGAMQDATRTKSLTETPQGMPGRNGAVAGEAKLTVRKVSMAWVDFRKVFDLTPHQ